MKNALSRRTMLRGLVGGAAAVLALPALDEMFNANGTAYAGGGAIPKRFGLWFWGDGAKMDQWIPDATGAGYAPKAHLQPFADAGVLGYTSVVSGLDLKLYGTVHHIGHAGMLSGSSKINQYGYPDFDGPTIKEYVASKWTGKTSIDSLDVGISTRGFDFSRVFNGETSPTNLYKRLFGNFTPTNSASAMQAAAAHKSVLDATMEDAKALQKRLGAAGKARLDQHLTLIQSIESRLGQMSGCAAPLAPPADAAYDANHEDLEKINTLMCDMLAVALSCDMTRVINVTFTQFQTDTFFWQVGATNGLHATTHDPSSAAQSICRQAATFSMKQLAYLVKRLHATPEGAGTILDSCCIYATTEVAEGETHSTFDIPALVIGKAGGALKGGIHYRSPNKENATNVLLSCLHAVDIQDQGFGKAGGYSEQTIAPLFT